jgi:hypothetical protein
LTAHALGVVDQRRLDDLAGDLHLGEQLVRVGLADEDDDGRAARLQLRAQVLQERAPRSHPRRPARVWS